MKMNTTCAIVTAAIAFLVLLMLFGGQSGYAEIESRQAPGPVKFIKKGESCDGVTCTASMCNCKLKK